MKTIKTTRGRPAIQSVGAASAALASLFLVLLSVFVFTSRLVRGDDAGRVQLGREAGAASAPRSLGRGQTGGSVASRTEDSPAAAQLARLATKDAASEFVSFEDPALGLSTSLPAGWREATFRDAADPHSAADSHGATDSLNAADRDRLLEDPASGARLAISAWDARDLAPLELWVMGVASGMRSIDGRWPSNARLAGEDAIALWAPESPTQPARYAVFLAHGGRYYRLAYAANDGGAAMGAYALMLARLRWLDARSELGSEPSDVTDSEDLADAETATLPPLPLPGSRYFPMPEAPEATADPEAHP
jgi:hypothetical protein